MRQVKITMVQEKESRYSGDEVKSFAKILRERSEAILRIEAAFSLHLTAVTINTSSLLIDYFKKRATQSATLEEIVIEKKVMKSLITELSGDAQTKRGNMVETAYDAALCDGIFLILCVPR